MLARTESNMLPLGTVAPEFSLIDTKTDQEMHLKDLQSEKATVIMFICNHCPFVKHVVEEIVSLANDYQSRDVAFIAINSNDIKQYPEDAPDKMKQMAERYLFPFPYLFDESQSVAKAYDAACTPDFYVFDGSMKLVYRGQLDDSRPDNGIPVTGQDLRAALDAVLSGKRVNSKQKPSLGCNIKWKQ